MVEARFSKIYENNYVSPDKPYDYTYKPIQGLRKLDPIDPANYRKSLEDLLVEVGLEAIHPLELKARADALRTHHLPPKNKCWFPRFFETSFQIV